MKARASSPLRVNIFAELRQEILACRLPPNSEIREQELADRFGVSKSPVREALQRLQQEALVIVVPRQGYRVAPITISDSREMFQLRKILESAGAEAAAKDATDSQLTELDRYRDFDGGDTDQFIIYNKSFHHAVALCSGNERLAEQIRRLEDETERLVRVSISVYEEEHSDGLVKEHDEIIDALQRRQGRTAARLLRNHIERGEKRVLKKLGQMVVLE